MNFSLKSIILQLSKKKFDSYLMERIPAPYFFSNLNLWRTVIGSEFVKTFRKKHLVPSVGVVSTFETNVRLFCEARPFNSHNEALRRPRAHFLQTRSRTL